MKAVRAAHCTAVPEGIHVRHMPSALGGPVERSTRATGPATHVAASGLDGVAWVMADACEQPLAEHDVVR
jgi:hypothetical protein